MKRWIQHLVDQLDFDWSGRGSAEAEPTELSEERATVLFMIDIMNKHLIEIDSTPIRKVRETLDGFAKELIHAESSGITDVLFRLRQFFASYRIEEYTYLIKTFDDFRGIIWDFVDQLAEDLSDERKEDQQVKAHLEKLKEAVELNSIDTLRSQSREFIDIYVQTQGKKEKRRTKRLESARKNLDIMKKQLVDANTGMRIDPLTGALNRRGFDEQIAHLHKICEAESRPATLIAVDIDHFKKINDSYGHDTGDFILKELVNMLREVFARKEDVVARIGGEEFVILLPGFVSDAAVIKAQMALDKIRGEVFVKDSAKIRFTVSMGIAELLPGETTEQWLKRSDQMLYHSKNTGRNRYTLDPKNQNKREEVA